MSSTRWAAASGVGHGAPLFNDDLLAFQSDATSPLPPLAMRRAFPGSDYYGGSAPARGRRLTLRLACPDGGARRHRAGSHVRCRSLVRVGAQLFPCGPVVTITRTLATRRRRHDRAAPGRVPRLSSGPRAPLARPISVGFEPGAFA